MSLNIDGQYVASCSCRHTDSRNLRHSAKATYAPLRRWGEWQRDGPTYTSQSIQILILYLNDSGETPSYKHSLNILGIMP
eukprot:3511799-Pleurochrysis_carterae.AAC.1